MRWRLTAALAGVLLVAAWLATPRARAEDAGAPEVATPGAPRNPPGNPPRHARHRPKPAAKLGETSTLAEWKAASAAARSEVAVSIAKKKLAATATKLEVATTAMEINGCLSATARDSRFDAWQVAPTATTCLTAPERPAKQLP